MEIRNVLWRRFVGRLHHAPTLIFTSFLVLALAAGGVLEPPARLALWALIGIFILYLACVMMVRFDDLVSFYRFVVWAFFFGVLLNLGWELWHSVYFKHFSDPGYFYPELVQMLWGAAIADGVVVLGLFFALTVSRGGAWDWQWPPPWRHAVFVVVLAAAVQIGVEMGALATGMWSYNAKMPIIPVLNVGLTPVLQMPVLVLPIFWLAQRMLCSEPHELAKMHERIARDG